MTVPLDAKAIAALHADSKEGERLNHVQVGQTQERIQLATSWQIGEGEHVLELGCGQGDCTAVLATAVGSKGSVTALDPASPDYGNPITLGNAQKHLMASKVGEQITFVRDNAVDFLAKQAHPKYSTAVLAQCMWYFNSPDQLFETFKVLHGNADRLCLAEWALRATQPEAEAHVLAALTQASLECRKPVSISNIRTVLSPSKITDISLAAGWKLDREEIIETTEGMHDGKWEVGAVLSPDFEKEIEESVKDQREKAVVHALRDATRAASDLVKGQGKKVRSMDVWCAIFN